MSKGRYPPRCLFEMNSKRHSPPSLKPLLRTGSLRIVQRGGMPPRCLFRNQSETRLPLGPKAAATQRFAPLIASSLSFSCHPELVSGSMPCRRVPVVQLSARDSPCVLFASFVSVRPKAGPPYFWLSPKVSKTSRPILQFSASCCQSTQSPAGLVRLVLPQAILTLLKQSSVLLDCCS